MVGCHIEISLSLRERKSKSILRKVITRVTLLQLDLPGKYFWSNADEKYFVKGSAVTTWVLLKPTRFLTKLLRKWPSM